MSEITLENGTTISLGEPGPMGRLVIGDAHDAPDDMRNHVVGRLFDGGFQPAPFAAFTLLPGTLRAIADLIESEGTA